ncbi:hypothetical protein [Enterococcus sp. DIV0187]|uniref:hypothetical protein n=1 Tax=Enterococcus sp. DIV0187 TaxID=2774644 RepID=UPI003F252076
MKRKIEKAMTANQALEMLAVGLTNTELAELLDVSRTAAVQKRNGARSVTLKDRQKMISVFDLNDEDILHLMKI